MTTTSELAHLTRALKAPRIRRAAAPLADRARAEGWPYERYLAAVLEEEVLAPGKPPAASCGSRPRGCRRSRPWTTSTSASNARSASS